MKGLVDESRRALVDVKVRGLTESDPAEVSVWIDTAFNGHFVFSRQLIEQLRLKQEAATEAVLADGSKVLLESFARRVDWFGEEILAQVIANEGRLPLLGTELLVNRRVVIDYANRTLEIT